MVAEREQENREALDEKPELDESEQTVTKWQPSQDVMEAAEACVADVFPMELRPSDATIEEFYRIACNLYKSGKYKEALPFFQLLASSNPKDMRYSMAMGACMHMQKKYKDAALAYTMTSVLDPDNPMPQYHLADCMIRMHENAGAYIALEMAVSRCNKNPSRYKGLLGKVNAMLNQLKKDFEAKKAQGITNFREGAEPPDIPPGLAEHLKQFKQQ